MTGFVRLEVENQELRSIAAQALLVRYWQKKYFKERTREALEASKAAERELDRQLSSWNLDHNRQPSGNGESEPILTQNRLGI